MEKVMEISDCQLGLPPLIFRKEIQMQPWKSHGYGNLSFMTVFSIFCMIGSSFDNPEPILDDRNVDVKKILQRKLPALQLVPVLSALSPAHLLTVDSLSRFNRERDRK